VTPSHPESVPVLGIIGTLRHLGIPRRYFWQCEAMWNTDLLAFALVACLLRPIDAASSGTLDLAGTTTPRAGVYTLRWQVCLEGPVRSKFGTLSRNNCSHRCHSNLWGQRVDGHQPVFFPGYCKQDWSPQPARWDYGGVTGVCGNTFTLPTGFLKGWLTQDTSCATYGTCNYLDTAVGGNNDVRLLSAWRNSSGTGISFRRALDTGDMYASDASG
jgi:hypothetical protein